MIDKNIRALWLLGVTQPLFSSVGETVGSKPAPVQTDKTNPGRIVFGAEYVERTAPVPGYNAPAPLIRLIRDPSSSLIAFNGMPVTEAAMMEIPLVLDSTTVTVSQVLAGWRIGFAEQYVGGDHIEHSAVLLRVFDILRRGGAQLVPVQVRFEEDILQFTLQSNEVDDLVSQHRLDALVSDDQSAAFHRARVSGYPALCEPLEGGAKLWFYSAQWSRDALPALLCAYRQISTRLSAAESDYETF